MHEPRWDLGTAVVEGKIYAMGGLAYKYAEDKFMIVEMELTINEVYDPFSNSWTYRAPMPIASSGFATAVVEGKIYCINEKFNLVYDTVLDVWESKTTMPLPQKNVQANTVDGKIFVFGSSPNSSLTLVYDPLVDSWTYRTSKPDGFWGYDSAVYEGKIYVVGVYAEPSYWLTKGLATSYPVESMVQLYNTQTDAWSVIATSDKIFYNPNTVHCRFTSGVYAPDSLYCLYSPLRARETYAHDLLVIDLESNSWKSLGEVPLPRRGFAMEIIDDIVYVLGGYTNGFDPWCIHPYRVITPTAILEQYVPLGFGQVAPVVSILSLEDGREYAFGDVPLVLGLDRSVSWLGYSLDGQANVTIWGNTTLTGLTRGGHNITVFAEEGKYGSIGTSQTIVFTVAPKPLFPLGAIVATTGAAVVIIGVCVGLVVLRKHHYHKKPM
ncbi:MAG: hypothetical protein LBH79_06440 [Nitrososphaerota archaeon]|nr:hypothetical protein [Nitrososphaerota archaeon]